MLGDVEADFDPVWGSPEGLEEVQPVLFTAVTLTSTSIG